MTQLTRAACRLRCTPPHSECRAAKAVDAAAAAHRHIPEAYPIRCTCARGNPDACGPFELEASLMRRVHSVSMHAWCGGLVRSRCNRDAVHSTCEHKLIRLVLRARRARLAGDANRARLVRERLVARCICGVSQTHAWYGSFASRVVVSSFIARDTWASVDMHMQPHSGAHCKRRFSLHANVHGEQRVRGPHAKARHRVVGDGFACDATRRT